MVEQLSFHEKIKLYREKKGIQQHEMANMVGVAKSTYSLYESGKREPDVLKIKKISAILNISADELLEIPVFDDVEPTADNALPTLPTDEQELLDNYRQLNEDGQERLLETSEELTEMAKYKKDDTLSGLA